MKIAQLKSCYSQLSMAVWQRAVATLLVVTALGLASSQPNAAPLAGTTIGNTASATYTDASSTPRTATSNLVETIVQQVAAVTLVNTQTQIVAPGGTVYFPHTLTNTGNGTDTFALSTTNNAGTTNFTSIAIYPDANSDGVPDSGTAITSTGALAAGGVFNFVVAATVPGTATAGQTDNLTVTATSGFTPATTANNTDTANVTANAVVNITKAASAGAGNPGTGPYTYTITYTNSGNNTATAVTITDTLQAGLTYVGGSGRWSVTGATALTDATADLQPSAVADPRIDYSVTGATITAIINQVAPGQTGQVSFQVNVNAGISAQVINNTANLAYNDGSGAQTDTSNTVPFNVNQVATVVANGSNVSNVDGTGEPVTVASASQGSTVSFNNHIWNTGNGTDTFDITIPANSFPVGSTVILYKSDGVSPLVDTNSNGTPDTGPVAAGSNYLVVAKVTLPPSATGGPYSITKRATSDFNSAQSNDVTDTLTSIAASTVDLTNDSAGGPGVGTGPEVAPVKTNDGGANDGSGVGINPSASTNFTLVVSNTSAASDSYNLTAWNDAGATSAFGSGASAGWTLSFKAGACPGGATITNTGTIAAGANTTVCATVGVPASAAATTAPHQAVYFRIVSPTSGASDIKLDAVKVATVRSIVVVPNNSGQAFPGGIVDYTHTVTNNGNVTEGDALGEVVLSITNSLAGWNAVVYWDANNDGVWDATDPVVTDLAQLANQGSTPVSDPGLDPGESARVFVKVTAFAGAATGDTNATTLTGTTTGAINGVAAPAAATATDTTQVIAGQVTLSKTQALDANCDGTADGSFTAAQLTTGAVPGACIRYRIVATNVGTAAVSGLVVSDTIPTNTRYDDGSRNSAGGTCGTGAVDAAAATTVGTISAPACNTLGNGSAGVTATVGALNPAQSAEITFGVMIDN